jgi:multidrug resistance efflux pump
MRLRNRKAVRLNAVLAAVDGSSNTSGCTGSVFSLLTPDNATGNCVNVVQGIPRRTDFDSSPGQVFDAEGLLKPDLSSDPDVRLR